MTEALVVILERLAWALEDRTCAACGCLCLPNERCPNRRNH